MGINNNRFIISKKGTDNHVSDFVKHDAGEKAREILLSTIGTDNGTISSPVDLFNIKSLKNDKEIEKSINTLLSKDGKIDFDINTSEGLEKINKILKESIRFYKETFYREYPIRSKKLRSKFNTKQEVIDFLKLTLKGDVKSEIACFIGKIAYVVNQIHEDPKLHDLDKKANFMIGQKIIPGIQINDYEFFKTFGIGNGSMRINGKNIDFRIRYRGKESDKSALKMFNDPKYGLPELISDSLGLEFEIDSEESAYLLLNHFVEILFMDIKKNGTVKSFLKNFKNKDLLTLEGLNKLIDKGFKFNKYFIKFIEDKINKDGYEDKNNELYQDAKVEGITMIPKDLRDNNSKKESCSVELRVVYVGNENEEGLSDHRVLDMLKIVFGVIRGTGYIRVNEVKKYINILLKEHPDLVEDKGLTKELIFNYYIEKKLLKVKTGKKILYTSRCRYDTMHGTNYYPDTIKK